MYPLLRICSIVMSPFSHNVLMQLILLTYSSWFLDGRTLVTIGINLMSDDLCMHNRA